MSEILTHLLRQKPSDKTVKAKNLFRLLADIISAIPLVAYKILIILGQRYNETVEDEDSTTVSYYQQLYKILCTTHRNLKLEQALKQDLKTCWENEPVVLGHLCKFLYIWFEDELHNHSELLRMFMSALDPSQLQEIVWDVASGKYMIIDSNNLCHMLSMLDFLLCFRLSVVCDV